MRGSEISLSTPLVYAIVARTGRQIGAFSAHPFEREVMLQPGSLLSPIGRFRSESPAIDVVVLEQLAGAAQAPAVEVASPGKFTSRISLR